MKQAPIDLNKEPRCRVCAHLIATQYTMCSEKNDKLVYQLCGCGTIQHGQDVDLSKFNQAYLDKMRETKFFKDRLLLWQRVYLPLIEEHTYGRESLDIGFGFEEQLFSMQQRGWLADGIDTINNNHITGDFESYDFKGKRYDFIILSHVLASFKDPVVALKKAAGLLKSGGWIFVAAPDTSRCVEFGYGAFGHWSPENRTMISMAQNIKQLERLGFEAPPVVAISNLDKRFLYFNDYHLIMRKGLCLEDAKTQ